MIIKEVAGVLEAKQIQSIIVKECGAQSTLIDASGKFERLISFRGRN
jgi:hypothetical protein